TRYIDEAFPGPSLQPRDVKGRARMNQIVGMLDAYAYRTLVWDIYVETVSKPKRGEAADGDRVAAALPRAATFLAALSRLKAEGAWLCGETMTLADLHAAPMFSYFTMAGEGRTLLSEHPSLMRWWEEISALPSFKSTEPSS